MADLESSMLKGKSPEDSIFYYHSSEDRIVLSHALFWVMTKSLKRKVAKEKNRLLIRQYQEEDAKQHKDISDAEHKSIDKLTELMATVWSDTSATPEQKQAQCDKILDQQKTILEAQKKRQE